MEPEEIQRKIEFLLEQQAQFMIDLQQSRELSDQRHDEMARAIIGFAAIGGTLARSHRTLAKHVTEIAAGQTKLRETMDELGAAQKATEESLHILMLTVERHLREHHGGENGHTQS